MSFEILRRSRLALIPLVAITVFAVACSGGGDAGAKGGAATAPKAAGGGQRTIPVVMKDNVFEPKNITVTAGETITFALNNQGPSLHNMHVQSDDVDPKNALMQPIEAGKTGQLVVKFPKKGTVKFQCDLHTPDMAGTITVN